MPNKKLVILFSALLILIAACNKKHVPESSSSTANNTAAKKPVVKKPAAPLPKVITVNDKAASKSFDGRLYYDLNGKRYWRNYNDGKYYLFNKNMYSDSAFIPH
ncbi:hypothetical protein [Ferruginibacter sp.]